MCIEGEKGECTCSCVLDSFPLSRYMCDDITLLILHPKLNTKTLDMQLGTMLKAGSPTIC